MENKVKLSVLIITCNLEKYIERALNSVFCQQHHYPYEVIVCDDFSTDSTRDILLRYQQQYPLIKLILHSYKVGLSKNYLAGLQACRGEYIAMLDGDDYWTDPLKINKQIEFLDSHTDFTLSCHRHHRFIEQESRYEEDFNSSLFVHDPAGFEVTTESFFKHWLTQTVSVVLRRNAIDCTELNTYANFKDTHLFYSVLKKGRGYVHSFFGGVYVVHQTGDWNKRNAFEKWKIDYLAIAELLNRYKDDETLRRTHALYRYGLWEFEYKEILSKYRFPWLRSRAYILKFKMWFNNPYTRITGKKITPTSLSIVLNDVMQDRAPIKISILIFTYNLKEYIEKALNSVLAQAHPYTYEIVVCDDCSTDGTYNILLEYQKRYSAIKVIRQQSNVGLSKNYLTGLKACHGEYIAMLDGDDYWTDSLKLQTQIQFLDGHSDYVLSCHRYKRYLQQEDRFEDDPNTLLYLGNSNGFEIDPEKFFTHWITQTLTIVLRTSALDFKEFGTYPNFKDTHIFFSALQKGRGYAHNFFGGVYTVHQAGDWNSRSPEEKWKIDFITIDELFKRYRNNRIIQRTHAIYYYVLLEFKYKRLLGANKFYFFPSVQWIKMKMKLHYPYDKELGEEYLLKNSIVVASPELTQKELIKISVLMVTYNQENFITKALDSVLEQRHAYPYEIVIGDDCSTDKTRDILLAYWNKHPDIIKLLFHGVNVGASKNYLTTLELCRGEYVAMLDGDDYWTDPEKLQKQITFLDNNPDFVISTHRFRRYYVEDGSYQDDLYPEIYESHPEGLVIEPDKFFLYWVAQTLTVVFRRSAADLAEFKTYKHFDDMHLFFSVFQRGRGYAHGFFGGVYNIHQGGVWSKLNMRNKWRNNLILSNELIKNYPHNKALKLANATFYYELLKYEYNEAVAACRYPTLSGKVFFLKYQLKVKYPY